MRLALFYSLDDVPVKGVVRPKWHDIVVETAPRGCPRINRLNYEICVLQSLRERLRTKEIWIEGAHRYQLSVIWPSSQIATCAKLRWTSIPIDLIICTPSLC